LKGTSMKRIENRPITVALMFLITLAGALAQPEPGQRASKEQMVARRLEKIDAAVKLNPDQKAKIKIILEDEMTAMEKNMIVHHQSGQRQDFEQIKAEMEKVRDAANTKIRAILTEKQQVAYTKFLTDEGKNHPGGNERPKPPISD